MTDPQPPARPSGPPPGSVPVPPPPAAPPSPSPSPVPPAPPAWSAPPPAPAPIAWEPSSIGAPFADSAGGAPPPPPDGLPFYTTPEPPAPARRSPARVAAVAVGAVALLAGTAFAVYAMTRPDGSDSPEGAVHQMFSAIDHEDALGVVESLPPSERKVLRDPLIDSTKELQRLGVLKSFPLNDVPGADLKVSGLQTSTTTLADGVVLVNVTGGTISGTSIPDDIPLGDNLRKTIEDNGGKVDFKADSFSEDLSKDHLHLVAIKEDGGWHVSLAYSIAEAARSSAQDSDGHPLPVPSFGGGPTPVGADDPTGAVKGLVDAAVAYDAERVIAMTDPKEMRALYDYAPLFLPKIAKSAATARSDGDATVSVARLDTDVVGDGDVRRVQITGFDVTIGTEVSNQHIVYDGTCYDFTSTYPSYDYARDPGYPVGPNGDIQTGRSTTSRSTPRSSAPQVDHQRECQGDNADSSGSTGLFGGLGMFGSTSARPFAVTVTLVDGRWYVSPVRTILDTVVEGLRSMKPEDIQKMGSFFGGSYEPGSSSSSNSGDPSGGTYSTEIPSTDPFNSFGPSPDATMPVGPLIDPTMSLTPASAEKVIAACSTQLDAFFTKTVDVHDAAYYQAVRDLYDCSAAVVPGFASCRPLIDAAWSARTEQADAAMAACLNDVTG